MHQHSPTRDYVPRGNFATPQLRRFDYGASPISPGLPRHPSPPRRTSPRRLPYVIPSLTSKQPPSVESENVSIPQILYLQKSPLETHKDRMQNKLRYTLLSLTMMCFICSITAYFSYSHALSGSYHLGSGDDFKEPPETFFGYQIHVWRNLKQMIFVASWSTFITSLGTVFVIGGQLICALKLYKLNPECPPIALRFLLEGKVIRTTTVFVWFLSVLFFFFVFPSTVWYQALETVPKAVCASIGLVIGILCLFASVQSIYSLCKNEYTISSNFSIDEKLEFDAGGYKNNKLNFDTLV
ncbi:hypothetical protein FO519_008905 [Halicephalobus sp. NKZ332]|nr:hypothetical protein FO519_008905 [Halicephalobus sp. NKZ332]